MGGASMRRRLSRRPAMSVVVVAYAMARELPRTLVSLSRPYQVGINDLDYEVVVVDNGSPTPVVLPSGLDPPPRLIRLDPAPPSPAHAANVGVAAGRAPLVTVVLDGARMVSPGAIAAARAAAATHDRAVVTTPAWHLGHAHQSVSIAQGYGPDAEDALLDSIAWPRDGYRLFDISALAGSNPGGMLDGPNESCFLTVRRALWQEVGGLDERFDLAGGGLVNLDLWRRILECGASPVVILGEGSFHQVHGGASTKPAVDARPWHEQYEKLRGRPYTRPAYEPTYFGRIGQNARRWVTP